MPPSVEGFKTLEDYVLKNGEAATSMIDRQEWLEALINETL